MNTTKTFFTLFASLGIPRHDPIYACVTLHITRIVISLIKKSYIFLSTYKKYIEKRRVLFENCNNNVVVGGVML